MQRQLGETQWHSLLVLSKTQKGSNFIRRNDMQYVFKILMFVCAIMTAGLMMRGFEYFWITAILTLICAGFAMQEEDEFVEQFDSLPDDWEDFKSQYEEPDGDDSQFVRTLPSSEYVDGEGIKLDREDEEIPF